MPNRKIVKLIKELNSIISKMYNDFKGVYLYGSQATGMAGADSDIDLVGVFGEVNFDKEFEIAGVLCDLMYKYDVYIDMHHYTPQMLERNPFYYNEVVKRGTYFEAV